MSVMIPASLHPRRSPSRASILAIGTLLVVGAVAASPIRGESPDPRTLLGRIERTYRASPGFTMRFVETYAPAGFPDTAPENGRLALQGPASIRFDYDGPEGKVYAFDGATAFQYVAMDRQLVTRPLAASELERLPILFLRSAEQILSRHKVRLVAVEGGLLRLELVSREASGPARIELLATPAGEVRGLSVFDVDGNRTTFVFSDLRPAARRPASDFTLSPPPGTRVVAG